MQIGMITVDGSPIGVVALTLGEPDKSTPDFSSHDPLTLAHNQGPAIDDHAQHGRRGPSAAHRRPEDGGHHNRGHRHGPGHYPRGEAREKEQKNRGLGNIPYSSSGNPFDRGRFAKELQEKPWLKEKMAHISLGENQDPHANLAVIETMMNRAVVRGTSLEQQAKRHRSSGRDEGGYYAGWAPNFSDNKRAMFEHNLGEALGQSGRGQSNITNYATDNSSGALAARERATGSFVHHSTINGENFFSPGHAEPALRDRWHRLHKQAIDHEKGQTSETAAAPKDLIVEGNKGMHLGEQFKGTPKWGWDSGAWKDLHKSRNVEDRRNAPTKGHTTQELNRAKENKRQGDIDTMLRGHQNYDSKLSKDAGIDALKSDDSAGRGDKSYPPTIEGFKKKFGRDPETDAELEFYDK